MKIDNRLLNIQANVQELSDHVLIDQTDFLAEHERGMTILVLRHLREVEVRRLYVDQMAEYEEQKNNAQLPMSPKVARASQFPKSHKVIRPLRKPLSASVKRYVWQRANACCEHIDAKSGTRCDSKFPLQPDHIVPLALGGSDEIENIQLLCRSHNSRRAIKTFGVRR